jgi:hypothetical protein
VLEDRQLAKRMARDARATAKAQARRQAAHAKAVRKRERSRAEARRELPVKAVLAVATAAAGTATEGGDWALYPVAVVAGVGALRAVRALRRPPLPPLLDLALPPAVAPPPPVTSAAWPAVRRLEAVRVELTRLVPLVAPAGRDVADEAWRAAGEADAALRWQAARLAAVEPHRGADPELLRPLLAGVACQERLLAAVADLVVASADPQSSTRLVDVTDRLHGLAQGLREVR